MQTKHFLQRGKRQNHLLVLRRTAGEDAADARGFFRRIGRGGCKRQYVARLPTLRGGKFGPDQHGNGRVGGKRLAVIRPVARDLPEWTNCLLPGVIIRFVGDIQRVVKKRTQRRDFHPARAHMAVQERRETVDVVPPENIHHRRQHLLFQIIGLPGDIIGQQRAARRLNQNIRAIRLQLARHLVANIN